MTATSEPAIDLHDVYLTYSRGAAACHVLTGTDFRVPRGESVLLVGPSGCGKSTLLSIVGCILKPDSGRVNILGQTVTSLDDDGRAIFRRESIGFVFQRFHLIRGLTAIDNIVVPLSLGGCPARQARRRAEELLAAVGLADKALSTSQQLSSGQCQRVAIARALAADPQIILADEPTASLDADNGQGVMQLLSDLTKQRNKTLVVVTHDERIVTFADRICRMHAGQLSDAPFPRGAEPALTFQ